MTFTLHHGDSREVLKTLAEASVDSIVTDPPYHLTAGKKGGTGPASVNLESPYGRARVTTGFMGMTWDGGDVAMRPEVWAECLRVLKPGGYLLAFSGTRTYHRMACAIEDAGFEVRDQIGWLYGSGFPKSHNGEWGGTALKPAWEPICMARKPLIGTVEENWRAHGTGALNIGGCRIQAAAGDEPFMWSEPRGGIWKSDPEAQAQAQAQALGRWPANIIHDGSDEVTALFPWSESGTGAIKRATGAEEQGNTGAAYGKESRPAGTPMVCHGNAGSAARFFYCAKADKEDRDEGLAHRTARAETGHRRTNLETADRPHLRGQTLRKNVHPTVKPTELMRYLCRLVTPKGGLVLDPFMGSGSTGKAAMLEGFRFVGIDMTAEYVEIASARIEFARKQGHQPDLLEAA